MQTKYAAILIELFPQGRAHPSHLFCNCNEEQLRYYSRLFKGSAEAGEAGGFDLRRWLLRMNSPIPPQEREVRKDMSLLDTILDGRMTSCMHMYMLREAQNSETVFSRTKLGIALSSCKAEPADVLSRVKRQNSLQPLSPAFLGDIMETLYVSSESHTLQPPLSTEASRAHFESHAAACSLCKETAATSASTNSNSVTAASAAVEAPPSSAASLSAVSSTPPMYEKVFKKARLGRGYQDSVACVRKLSDTIFSVCFLLPKSDAADSPTITSSASTFDGDSCILAVRGTSATCFGRQHKRCSCQGGKCEEIMAQYLLLTREVPEPKLYVLPKWFVLSSSLRLHTNHNMPPKEKVMMEESLEKVYCSCSKCSLLPATTDKARLFSVIPRLGSMAACQSRTYYDTHQVASLEVSKDDRPRFLNNCGCFGSGCDSIHFAIPHSTADPPPSPGNFLSSDVSAAAASSSASIFDRIPRVCSDSGRPSTPSPSFAPPNNPASFVRSQVLSPYTFASGILRCLCMHEPIAATNGTLELYSLPHDRCFHISAGSVGFMQVSYYYCTLCHGYIFCDGREEGLFFVHTLSAKKELDCVFAIEEATLNMYSLLTPKFTTEGKRMRALLQENVTKFPFLEKGKDRQFFITVFTLWMESAVLPPISECPICKNRANCTCDGVLAGPRKQEMLKLRERSGQSPATEAPLLRDMECSFLGPLGQLRKLLKTLLRPPKEGEERGGITSKERKAVYFDKNFSPRAVETSVHANMSKKDPQTQLMIARTRSIVQALMAVCEEYSSNGRDPNYTKFIPPHFIPFFESIVLTGYSSAVFPFPVEVHRGIREFLKFYGDLTRGTAVGELCVMDKENCDRIRAAVFDKEPGVESSLLQRSFKHLPLFLTALEQERVDRRASSIDLIKRLNSFIPLLMHFADMTCHFIITNQLQQPLRVNIVKLDGVNFPPCDKDTLNFQEVTQTYSRSLGIVGNRHIHNQNREAMPKLQRVPRKQCGSKKVFSAHKTMGSGFVTCVCSHGFIQGIFAMSRKESSSLIADIIWNCFPHLGHLCYDDMCHLWPNAIERDRRSLMLRCFVAVDASHWKTHLCAAHKNVQTFAHLAEVRMPVGNNYQTQACEQLHKRMGEDTGLRRLLAFLGFDKGLLYLHLWASARNAELLGDMKCSRPSSASGERPDFQPFLSRRDLRRSGALHNPVHGPDALHPSLGRSATSSAGNKRARSQAFSGSLWTPSLLSPTSLSTSSASKKLASDNLADDRYPEWRRSSQSSAEASHASSSSAAGGLRVGRPLSKAQKHSFTTDLQTKGQLTRVCVIGDGNCLFRAISYHLYGDEAQHHIVRSFAVRYMRIKISQYVDFLELNGGEFSVEEYLTMMEKPGSSVRKYGGQVEIRALSDAYQMDEDALVLGYLCRPHSTSGTVVSVTTQEDVEDGVNAFRLTHENNNHYNALVPHSWVPTFGRGSANQRVPGTYENACLSALEEAAMEALKDVHIEDDE